MLRRSLRWFSKNWLTMTTEELIPSATEFFTINPPPKSTLVVTGPMGTGKTSALHMAFAVGSKSKDPDMFLNVSFESAVEAPKNPKKSKEPESDSEDLIDPLNFVDSFNQNTVRCLSYLESKKLLSDSAKQEILSLLHNYAKKMCALSEEVDKETAERKDGANLIDLRREEKQIGLEIVNSKLESYRNVIKLTDVEYSGFQHAIDNVDIQDAFDITATAILAFRAEHAFGELSSAFLVAVLNLIGKACLEKNIQAPVLAIMESHLLFVHVKVIQFFEFLLNEFINTKTHFYSLIEGQGLYVGPLAIVEKNAELFEWCNIKENSEEMFKSYVKEHMPTLLDIDINNLWHFAYGNIGIAEATLKILKKKPVTVQKLIDIMTQSSVQSLNKTFRVFENDLGMNEDDVGMLEKVMNIDFPRVRAVAYFLYKLLEEPDYEIDVTMEDMINNLVIGRLCIFRVLYFNSQTMRLGLDKRIFSVTIPKCDIWKYNESWAERAKNKIAYNKMAQEILDYE